MRVLDRSTNMTADTWPEVLVVGLDDLLDEPTAGHRAVEEAAARSQRLELSAPVRLGDDPGHDHALLRFLTDVAEHLTDLDWTLAGEPPWPVRTFVHLPPPRDGADRSAREYAARWRSDHRVGLCTYRLGPGFVRIRDVRPDGPHLRVLIDGRWAEAFATVMGEGAIDGAGRQLLDDLTAAGLATTVGATTHVLPVHLRRWPIPYTSI